MDDVPQNNETWFHLGLLPLFLDNELLIVIRISNRQLKRYNFNEKFTYT